MNSKFWLPAIILIFFFGCNSGGDQALQFESQGRSVPDFNVDSAYAKLGAQVQMGSRNPGSDGHRDAQEYLVQQLERYAGPKKVFVQQFTHRGYEGDSLQMGNIIAAFNTESSDRIMLCAHWDTRPRAENDASNPGAPILGADDGASGVAVLLEMARLFSENQPQIGVDIVLFDGEDYGKEGDLGQYFLGSRYWSNYPPVENYRPRFAILLDMVGGQGARFPKELYSMDFAPALVNEIWAIADEKGYDSLFVDKEGARISDDHMVINRIRKIPIIDIIRHTVGPEGEAVFAPYWHTQQDSLDIIDKQTLRAVGEVLTELVYNRI
jgi:hypothetical protein